MNQHIQKQIEREIRKAYSGIIPDEQIEATIKWWNKLASRVWKDAEQETAFSLDEGMFCTEDAIKIMEIKQRFLKETT